MGRTGFVKRETAETSIEVSINLDGTGKSQVDTGIGFFDHMLALFSRHGLFDVNISAKGDLQVDAHHTVEDTGIVLGKAIAEALSDKKSITRYGDALVPMDEALALAVVDISGRPFLVYDVNISSPKTGDFDSELAKEFFRALAFNTGITLHLKLLYGTNTHHIIEAVFKAFARALAKAVRKDERIDGVMSTKGII